ncbi:UNVERIFIED_CONTAM: hypothetical protein HDU68_004397 [Siphonaria sp. JEL0065]|nr:hypothetical protein HDU68_004397 [Siphonaria sp. JEL0065]
METTLFIIHTHIGDHLKAKDYLNLLSTCQLFVSERIFVLRQCTVKVVEESSVEDFLAVWGGSASHIRRIRFYRDYFRNRKWPPGSTDYASFLAHCGPLQSFSARQLDDVALLLPFKYTLETVSISHPTNSMLENCYVLDDMPNLKSLHVDNKQYDSLGFIAVHSNLRKFGISFDKSHEAFNVEMLLHMRFLEDLALTSATLLNVQRLSVMALLKCLKLRETDVSDLEFLRQLPCLTHLYLAKTLVSDLNPVQHLTQLKCLDISSTAITTLEPVRNLINLSDLDISESCISDLEPLRNLKRLNALWAMHSLIDRLEPLSDCILMVFLDCDSTRIRSVEPLANMPKLRSLYLRGTQVKDLSPLYGLTSMETLMCEPELEEGRIRILGNTQT